MRRWYSKHPLLLRIFEERTECDISYRSCLLGDIKRSRRRCGRYSCRPKVLVIACLPYSLRTSLVQCLDSCLHPFCANLFATALTDQEHTSKAATTCSAFSSPPLFSYPQPSTLLQLHKLPLPPLKLKSTSRLTSTPAAVRIRTPTRPQKRRLIISPSRT